MMRIFNYFKVIVIKFDIKDIISWPSKSISDGIDSLVPILDSIDYMIVIDLFEIISFDLTSKSNSLLFLSDDVIELISGLNLHISFYSNVRQIHV
jgi:hypothetical protein